MFLLKQYLSDYEQKLDDLKIRLKQALEERDKEREHGRELSISSLNTVNN